jgi:hypothetical protein
MTVDPIPGDRPDDLGAALDGAAQGLASSICDAVSTDLAEARLDPVVRALTAIGVGIEALLALLRRVRHRQAGPARL